MAGNIVNIVMFKQMSRNSLLVIFPRFLTEAAETQ